MQRKLYFLVLLGSLYCVSSYGWVSSQAKMGHGAARYYQSSNPRVELKETRTLNQQQAPECYMFSFVGALESANQNGWNRSYNPEISAELMFIEKLRAWFEEVLENQSTLEDTFYFLDGGDIHHSMRLSVERGLVPQDVFVPEKPFEIWDYEALYRDVKNLAKDGRKVLAQARNEGLRQELRRAILKQLDARLSQDAGKVEGQFEWAGRSWTPQKFENAFGIKRNSYIHMLYPQGKWDMGDPWDLKRALVDLVQTFKGAFSYKQSSWPKIWNYIVKSLDEGLPVVLSVKWGRTYHVLNAVGYEYNNQNEIVNLKLQNTWGEVYGTHGFAYFAPDDIEKNVTTIWGFTSP